MFYIYWYEVQAPYTDDSGHTVYPNAEPHPLYDPEDPELGIKSAKLTMETNRGGSLVFSLPITHPLFDSVRLFVDGICVFFDNPKGGGVKVLRPIWFGRPISLSVTDNGATAEYTCEGALNFLNDDTLRPVGTDEEGDSPDYYANARLYFSDVIQGYSDMAVYNGYHLESWTSPDELEDTGEVTIIRPEWSTRLYVLNDYFLNNYSGYLNLNLYCEGTSVDKVYGYLSYTSAPFDSTKDDLHDYTMDISKNVVDFTMNQSALDVVSSVSADWYKPNGKIGGTIYFDADNSDNISDIDKTVKVIRELTISNCKSAFEASELARNYIEASFNKPMEVSISAIDPVFLPDTSPIPSLPLYEVNQIVRLKLYKNSGVGIKLMINKIEYDLLNPFVASYSLGSPLPSLSAQATQNKISEKIQVRTQIF